MEIERKYLVSSLPSDLDSYTCLSIEQAYICTEPVIRIRRENDIFYLTVKGSGMLSREELNLPLTKEAYRQLLPKAEGTVITKKRYLIPINEQLKVELDVFSGRWSGLVIAEVEFPDQSAADSFQPLSWFEKEVTFDPHYHNSWLSCH